MDCPFFFILCFWWLMSSNLALLFWMSVIHDSSNHVLDQMVHAKLQEINVSVRRYCNYHLVHCQPPLPHNFQQSLFDSQRLPGG